MSCGLLPLADDLVDFFVDGVLKGDPVFLECKRSAIDLATHLEKEKDKPERQQRGKAESAEADAQEQARLLEAVNGVVQREEFANHIKSAAYRFYLGTEGLKLRRKARLCLGGPQGSLGIPESVFQQPKTGSFDAHAGLIDARSKWAARLRKELRLLCREQTQPVLRVRQPENEPEEVQTRPLAEMPELYQAALSFQPSYSPSVRLPGSLGLSSSVPPPSSPSGSSSSAGGAGGTAGDLGKGGGSSSVPVQKGGGAVLVSDLVKAVRGGGWKDREKQQGAHQSEGERAKGGSQKEGGDGKEKDKVSNENEADKQKRNQGGENLALLNSSWCCVKALLPTDSLWTLRKKYWELGVEYPQIGVDSESKFLQARTERAKRMMKKPDAGRMARFLRRGVPAGCRLSFWNFVLLGDGEERRQAKKYLRSFSSNVNAFEWITDDVIRLDVSESVCDRTFFPFEAAVETLALALSRDPSVVSSTEFPPQPLFESAHPARLRTVPPSKFPIGKGAGGGPVEAWEKEKEGGGPNSNWRNTGPSHSLHTGGQLRADEKGRVQRPLMPPSGSIPFKGFACLVAPLCFLAEEVETIYPLARALYCTHLFRLHSIPPSFDLPVEPLFSPGPMQPQAATMGPGSSSSQRPRQQTLQQQQKRGGGRGSSSSGVLMQGYGSGCGSLVELCALFESLLFETCPSVVAHLTSCNLPPLSIAFPWIVRGFAGVLSAESVLLLWDRVIGFHSVQIVAVLAAAIFHFKQALLLKVATKADIEVIFNDLSPLCPIALLQQFLFLSDCLRAERQTHRQTSQRQQRMRTKQRDRHTGGGQKETGASFVHGGEGRWEVDAKSPPGGGAGASRRKGDGGKRRRHGGGSAQRGGRGGAGSSVSGSPPLFSGGGDDSFSVSGDWTGGAKSLRSSSR
eukprot:Cvel_13415.t1-p1 / transcript=Cvel_13415.t1 / gene=Cvel_13415 / organism=Chromera_velia_CCMP2878 / gene_product=TBC1 domain family member 19, putative / transcript_product=TBC1 domain family member 19, putative / location=Cvel_scaffold914:53173-62207(+) / protein_length=907 / sequence_SO=supercontig / SO=protein_coding / is_pseudo=false